MHAWVPESQLGASYVAGHLVWTAICPNYLREESITSYLQALRILISVFYVLQKL